MAGIPFNPYIVGNPIKTREMFFGREDDFQFVVKKLGAGISNQVLVFCGERRCGKTSILFQILGGRLGSMFLPILVDMQILAGIKDDRQFFRAILRVACTSLNLPELSLEELDRTYPAGSVEELFEGFLTRAKQLMPDRIVLFLLDEYELIEEKIRDGSLSENSIHYLAGALESPHRICFIFTGSTNLENRKVSYWRSLLGKSIYRKISYLSMPDTARLITEPLKDHIRYPDELVHSIYRLTGGHPFYTQVICQNLVDHLMEEQRNDPQAEELEKVVQGIIDNPLPQMIYSWNSLGDGHRLLLSALAGLLENEDAWAGAAETLQHLKRNRLSVPFDREHLQILLEEAYHREHLDKNDEERYRFRMDLWRRWVRREHSIWKVAKEAGATLRKRIRALPFAAVAAGIVVVGAALWYGLWYRPRAASGGAEPPAIKMPEAPEETQAPAAPSGKASGQAALKPPQEKPAEQPAGQPAGEPEEVREITLTASAAPFRVVVDETLSLTSEGQPDEEVIRLPSLKAGMHSFSFTNPATGENILLEQEVTEESRSIHAEFRVAPPEEAPVEAPAPSAEPRTGSLVLATSPAGAAVFLNGKDTGLKTPNLVENLEPGRYRVALILEGYRTEQLELTLEAGQAERREVSLSESFGEALFDVRPTARVLLDGSPLIETPYVKPVRIRAGRHTVTLINENLGVRKNLDIIVREGETLKIVEVLQ